MSGHSDLYGHSDLSGQSNVPAMGYCGLQPWVVQSSSLRALYASPTARIPAFVVVVVCLFGFFSVRFIQLRTPSQPPPPPPSLRLPVSFQYRVMCVVNSEWYLWFDDLCLAMIWRLAIHWVFNVKYLSDYRPFSGRCADGNLRVHLWLDLFDSGSSPERCWRENHRAQRATEHLLFNLHGVTSWQMGRSVVLPPHTAFQIQPPIWKAQQELVDEGIQTVWPRRALHPCWLKGPGPRYRQPFVVCSTAVFCGTNSQRLHGEWNILPVGTAGWMGLGYAKTSCMGEKRE